MSRANRLSVLRILRLVFFLICTTGILAAETSPSNQPVGSIEEVVYRGTVFCLNTRYCPDFAFWGNFPPGYITLTRGGKPVVYLWVDFTGLLTFECSPLNVPPPRGLPLLGTLVDNGMLQEVDQFFPQGGTRALFVQYEVLP